MSYESDQFLSEYLLMHYGSLDELMPWDFGPAAAADFTTRTTLHFPEKDKPCRVLDLGCAVGRSTFELSKTNEEVIGIDFSHNFIDAAEKLRTEGEIDYLIKETGKTSRPATAKPPAGTHSERVQFFQGDAMNLPEDLGTFDRIHAANLICRLPEPLKLLNRLPELVHSEGHLVLATPCTWLDEYTPPENQPEADTFSWLKSKLEPDFKLLSQHDEPFLIRETARKFQWSVSLLTVWERSA